jgi:hypothetical protein
MNHPLKRWKEVQAAESSELGSSHMDKVSQTRVVHGKPVFGSLSPPVKNMLSDGHLHERKGFDLSDSPKQVFVGRTALVDLLNFIHFRDGTVCLLFRSSDHSNSFFLRARPQPCQGDLLNCRLQGVSIPEFDPSLYQFDRLVVEDGTSIILVPAVLVCSELHSITLRLPDSSEVFQRRKSRRYHAEGVSVKLIQYDFASSGDLRDFCCDAFRVRVKPDDSQPSSPFDREAPVFAILHRDDQVFFTGVCRCVRQEDNTNGMQLVLISEEDKISRFKRSRIRNPRIRLELTPRISFVHPFFRKKIQLDVADISTSGFSVSEPAEESVLMPGMTIPDLTISYAGTVKLLCSAQVIYRSEVDEGLVRSGVSILDMSLEDYSRLAHILTNAMDPHVHVSGDLDQESLWEFFFSSGFIYPRKYSVLQSEKEGCKETCKRLYQENHEIARHFTYEKNGRIFGHISMVKAYDQTWVIHHHAAQTVSGKRNGFGVLKALMLFLNDMRKFRSANMKYAMCFYRPENRFPAAVFGDFASAIGNTKICSLDRFSYHVHLNASVNSHVPREWLIQECNEGDLYKLIDWYKDHSGGLMFDAMGLGQRFRSGESVEKLYERLGLVRRIKVFSLKRRNELIAGFIVNEADPGLNLSQLFSSITILVLNAQGFPWPLLSGLLSAIGGLHNMHGVPVLIYPPDSARGNIPGPGKHYEMWVLNAQCGEEYLDFIEKRFKLGFSKNILGPGIPQLT